MSWRRQVQIPTPHEAGLRLRTDPARLEDRDKAADVHVHAADA
jgi:hypothetical protein